MTPPKGPRREEIEFTMRTPSPKEQRHSRKQPHPKRATQIEEEIEDKEQQKYRKSTASQVEIRSLGDLSQSVEELLPLPQPFVVEQSQIPTDKLVRNKPQREDQPIIHSPQRARIRDPQQYEPILEKLMREREKQNEEFSRRYPKPDHKGEYPFSGRMGMMEDAGQRIPRTEAPVEVPRRNGESQTPYEQKDRWSRKKSKYLDERQM